MHPWVPNAHGHGGVSMGHGVSMPFAGAALREEEGAPESRAEVRGHGLSILLGVSLTSACVGVPWGRMLPGPPQRLGRALLCCSQHEEKEKAFKEQLAHLASLLPTLQVGPWGGQGGPCPIDPCDHTSLCTGPPGDLLRIPELRQQSRVPGPGLCEWWHRHGVGTAPYGSAGLTAPLPSSN